MTNGKTYIDDLIELFPDKYINQIADMLTPEGKKGFYEVMDATDTLMNNGMFNLDDKDDYIRKGFDIPRNESTEIALCQESLMRYYHV
jgi:poly-beta-hydroxyalkanoate depolymerase